MSLPDSFCPYVGLQPYAEADRDFFFGRERDQRILSSNLYAASLTVLYGASGVGKSSVLMAGVVPRLRSQPRTAVVVFREWQDRSFVSVLKSECVKAVESTQKKPLLVDTSLPLDDLLCALGEKFGGTTIIILDQFEEYFLYHPDSQGDDLFDVELARSINRDDIDANFLVALREDGLSKLDRFRARIPNLLANMLRLRHLDTAAAEEAIRKPLKAYNDRLSMSAEPVIIEDQLVSAILADKNMRTAEALFSELVGIGQTKTEEEIAQIETPLLQLVMTRIWHEENERHSHEHQLRKKRGIVDEEKCPLTLRLSTLEDLGGTKQIVRTHLDSMMTKLSHNEREICAGMFRFLVTPKGEKIAHATEDLVSFAESPPEEVKPLLKKLDDARVLRRIFPPERYEIFHDVLAPAVLDWRTRYVQARERAEAESRAAVEAAEKEKRLLRDRELAQAQALAEEQQRRAEVERKRAEEQQRWGEEQARAARRLRWSMGALLVVFLLAVLAGVSAWMYQESASRAEQKAAGLEAKLAEVVRPGVVKDEAMILGRTAGSFPAADEDYFRDMDRGIQLTTNEIKGRNTWIVWTGGNDRFWDLWATASYGAVDFLKILSSHPNIKRFSRDNRWQYFGLINEPCFEKANGPNEGRYGLWLDTRRKHCPPDPFEDEQKYPGVKIGARGIGIPVGSYYGYASGIVGLRLFPNPDFDKEAQKKWDPVRYYADPAYYLNKNLVRPYRVGMSCAFCHIGPSPVNPPVDPENPKWENLNSNPGAQYFRASRVFFWDLDEMNFFYQIFHTSRPGTLDTSLIANDYINNPSAINAIYNLGPRLSAALRWNREKLTGGNLNNKQFNDFPQTASLAKFFEAPDLVWTTHALKDGADSVGFLGALNRMFISIGLFSEEWLLHFNPLFGGTRVLPIRIEDGEKNSSYWNATVAQTPDIALFLLKIAKPDLLKDAPGGTQYLTTDKTKLSRGKVVFAQFCARCHSSKIPQAPADVDESNWEQYWAWTKTDDFKAKMAAIVMADDFLTDNYLSTDRRIPLTLLQTNACSPLATNAMGGNIWDNFSSQTYKDLPSVGKITVQNPIDGSSLEYQMPAGGRGYTRVPSLISLWSTAPFLLNNSVGKFRWEASVEARMDSFNDAIEKMLWPEKREKDAILGDKVPGFIDRTTSTSYIKIAAGYLPDAFRSLLSRGNWLHLFLPWLFSEGLVEIGPIPEGTPVSLLTNIDLDSDRAELGKLLLKMKQGFKKLEGARDQEAFIVFKSLVPDLLKVSKCPDFVVNKGHYFGTSFFKEEPPLSDDDKRALIEYLKTF